MRKLIGKEKSRNSTVNGTMPTLPLSLVHNDSNIMTTYLVLFKGRVKVSANYDIHMAI